MSSFNLVVNPLPLAITPEPIFQCSNGASTQAQFDLTINEVAVTGGASGMILTYYNTLADAQAGTSPIATPNNYTGTDNEIVYIRVVNVATGCFNTTTQLLRVTLGPVAVTPLPLHYCDPNNDGFGDFMLSDAINEIAGGSLPAGVTVSFYETATDALIGANPSLTSPYHNINPWTQTIYVRVFYTLTGCSNYVQLQLIVDPTPEATTPADYHLCDTTGAVGYESFDLTTRIPEILGSIDPAVTAVDFYTTLALALNGNPATAIGNVTGFTNQTQDSQILYVRVETIATGCYDIVELKLVVDPLPVATQPNYPQYSLCDTTGNIGFEVFDLASQVDDVLLGQTGMSVTFYPSLTDAQNNTNAITTPTYQNTSIYVQTLGIRVTNDLTHCYSISTMDIRVDPLPVLIPPATPYTVCDDDQDGISCDFDLTSLTTNLLQGVTAYQLSFHETLTDATTNFTSIGNVTAYCNVLAFNQTIYVRAEDLLTHCFSILPIQLQVNPSPEQPINLTDIVLCDTDSNPYNGYTSINLTVRTPDVLAQQPQLPTNYLVTYYTSLALAQVGTAPIINTTNYTNITTPQTIWVRVEDKITHCYNIGSFQLVINTPLLLTTPQPLSMCDNDVPSNDQHYTFDLTVRDGDITNHLPGYTVTYYPSYPVTASSVAIATPTAYYNVVGAVQTLGVMVTSPAGCKSYTSLDIRVLPVPTPNETGIPVLPAQCETTTGSGVALFDLTTNAAYIINGDPNVVLHYFPTQADLDNNTSEILTPAAALVGDPALAGDPINMVQYVYITVSSNVFADYTGRKCYKEVKQGFIVNPLPTVAAIADYQICEDDPVTNDGFEVFDLTSQQAALLAGNATTPTSTYQVSYYEDAGLSILISNPATYTNLTNPQTIYVEVTNTITGCKSDIGQFNILVNPKPDINFVMPDMKECDYDGVNDGQMLYTQSTTSALTSLAGYEADILGATQTAPTYIVEFYTSQVDAEAGTSANALTGLATYQVQTGTYWVRVTNTVTGCYKTDSFDVVIEKLAEPVITSSTGSNIACVRWNTTAVTNDLILDSGITAPNYTFNWYADGVLIAGESNSTLVVQNIPLTATHVVFTVEALSVNPPLLGCKSVITAASTFDVIKSGPAANIIYTVTNAFESNQIITVSNEGFGIYEYSMDDGPRQTSPVFENVSLGDHVVYIYDVRDPGGYSCGVEYIQHVSTIDYPHYFTPNGDGYHDTWNISGLVTQPTAKIYIFDRYGKLLKQISSTGEGWDGTFNGHLLPSDDYWFTVDFIEGNPPVYRQFKAHFAMKR